MPEWLNHFLDRSFLDNTVQSYLLAVAVFSITLGALSVLRCLFRKRAERKDEQARTHASGLVVGLIAKIFTTTLVAIAAYAGLSYLNLQPRVWKVAHFVLLSLLVVQGLIIVGHLAEVFLPRLIFPRAGQDAARRNTTHNLVVVIKAFLWVGGFLFLIDNLGFDVTSMVAGLGIGGIAVLAAQGILGDAFSSFTIYLDRPFEVGDAIQIGEFIGTVEQIGLKTTRIRSLSGELLVFSNSDLTGSRIRNYRRQQTRRVQLKIAVAHETTLEQLKAIPGMVREVIESLGQVKFDRAHFSEITETGLAFEIVYALQTPDYNYYMDTQQSVLLGLREHLDAAGIRLAEPLRRLQVPNEVSAAIRAAVDSTSNRSHRGDVAARDGQSPKHTSTPIAE